MASKRNSDRFGSSLRRRLNDMSESPAPRAPRLELIDPEAVGESALLVRLLAKSHAALKGYLGLRSALTHGQLGYRLRDLIAIFVAEAHGSVYMLSSHIAAARRVGIDEEAISDARHGR